MLRVLAFTFGVLLLSGYLTLKHTVEAGPPAREALPPSIDEVLDRLKKIGKQPVTEWRFSDDQSEKPAAADFDDSPWKKAGPGQEWRGNNTWVWFRTTITIPEKLGAFALPPGRVRLQLTVDDGGQAFVNGKRAGGKFEWNGEVVLSESAKPGDRFQVALRALNISGPGRLMAASLVFDALEGLTEKTTDYLTNLALARAVVKHLGNGDAKWNGVIDASVAAIDQKAVEEGAIEPLVKSLETASMGFKALKPLAEEYSVTLAGYSHIDLAWLWRWTESVQICKETFAQAVKFFDEFPEFHFSMTQAHAYRWMEEKEPELFAAMQKAVKAGRWEIVGGTMVELDCNLPDAESHARQILYGKRYFREKFGKDVKIGWCPDSFGYNGNLPQLLKKGGIDYFVTSKITWNDTNKFPHHLFWWEAPDGSRVLAFLPFAGYTFDVDGEKIVEHLADFEKESARKEVMFIYGVGNHGGGPTRQEIRRAEKLKKLEWFPKVKTAPAADFFARVSEEERAKLPTWKSELYLEYHRGTYTSQAANKKGNRKGEVKLMEAEKLALFAGLDGGMRYPAKELREAWDYLLFNQMHDILPGSSITPVYRDSDEDYAKMFAIVDGIERQAVAAIAAAHQPKVIDVYGASEAVHVFNTLSFERSGGVVVPLRGSESPPVMRVVDETGAPVDAQWATAEGSPALAFWAKDVPAHGHRTYHLTRANEPGLSGGALPLENRFLRIELDRNSGDVTSILHKPTGREAVAKGAQANRFQLFEDRPKQWDAWEIDLSREKWEIEKAKSVALVEAGPVRKVVRVTKTFLGEAKAKRAPTADFPSSFFTQDLVLWNESPRLDVEMTADWWEDQTALKIAFPLSIDPPNATYEIPFAHLERSTRRETSFDKARHEVSAQKWADMSLDGFGVSILNDCKYGYDALHNVIRLTALRSPKYPDPLCDRGRHEFTYAIYPHSGDWRTGGTVREAYSLNTPLLVHRREPGAAAKDLFAPFDAKATSGSASRPLLGGGSFLQCDAPNVMVTTVKKAEDGDAWIVRLYDWEGKAGDVTLTFPFEIASAEVTGIMEDPGKPVTPNGKSVTFPVGAYAIETVKVAKKG
jgi:alpha-mannosidase